jgi:hypothetical protein
MQERPGDRQIRHLRTFATVIDRVVDPVIGLVAPGFGDALTTLLGASVVSTAVRNKLPPIVIARMLLNLAIDALFGAIPLLGDVFDFVHQANRKNVDLLSARHETRRSTPRDWVFVGLAALLLVTAVVAAGYTAYRIVDYACTHLV